MPNPEKRSTTQDVNDVGARPPAAAHVRVDPRTCAAQPVAESISLAPEIEKCRPQTLSSPGPGRTTWSRQDQSPPRILTRALFQGPHVFGPVNRYGDLLHDAVLILLAHPPNPGFTTRGPLQPPKSVGRADLMYSAGMAPSNLTSFSFRYNHGSSRAKPTKTAIRHETMSRAGIATTVPRLAAHELRRRPSSARGPIRVPA